MNEGNKFKTAIFSMIVILVLSLAALNTIAQVTQPTVRIVLPERFRVLTDQYFDLRVEAENLATTNARLHVFIENENGTTESLTSAGALETTTDNDSGPSPDKAWTYRKVSFATPGIKSIFITIADGRRLFGVGTQVSVQKFDLQSQKEHYFVPRRRNGYRLSRRGPHRGPEHRRAIS